MHRAPVRAFPGLQQHVVPEHRLQIQRDFPVLIAERPVLYPGPDHRKCGLRAQGNSGLPGRGRCPYVPYMHTVYCFLFLENIPRGMTVLGG